MLLVTSLMLIMLISALAAACGGDEATPTPRPTATTPPASTPTLASAGTETQAGAGASAIEAPSITLRNFQFVPDTLEVEAGTKARFAVTSEGAGHTFTIEILGVDVSMPAGTTKTIEFDVPEGAPEQIQLKCRFHSSSGMVATLKVEGGVAGADTGSKEGTTKPANSGYDY